MLPLPPEYYLKVRDSISAHLATHSVKTKIGNVVLAAAVITAAHFDVEAFHRRIQLNDSLGHSLPKLPRQAPRGRYPQLAGVSPRASYDIGNRTRSRFAQICGLERGVGI